MKKKKKVVTFCEALNNTFLTRNAKKCVEETRKKERKHKKIEMNNTFCLFTIFFYFSEVSENKKNGATKEREKKTQGIFLKSYFFHENLLV